MDRFVRVLETDDWVVDYDRKENRYRVAYFVGLNFVDEVWFDEYKEDEYLIEPTTIDTKVVDKFNSIPHTSFWFTAKEIKEGE